MAAILALLAAVSVLLRTTCSTRIGNECRCWVTDQGQGEKGQPWHQLAIETGKKPIQAMGRFAGFGGHDFGLALKRALEQAGFAVDLSNNGLDAEALGEIEPYDAVVLDPVYRAAMA